MARVQLFVDTQSLCSRWVFDAVGARKRPSHLRVRFPSFLSLPDFSLLVLSLYVCFMPHKLCFIESAHDSASSSCVRPGAPRPSQAPHAAARASFRSDVPRTDTAVLGNQLLHAHCGDPRAQTPPCPSSYVSFVLGPRSLVCSRTYAGMLSFHRFLSLLLLLPPCDSTLRLCPPMLTSINALFNRQGAIRLGEDDPIEEDEKLSLPTSLPESATTESSVESSRTWQCLPERNCH